ncbi:MAG: transglycosylase domain-containing protein, partial [bacterium]
MSRYRRDRNSLKKGKAKEEKRGLRDRVRGLWRLAKILAVLLFVGWLALAYYSRHLDREITAKFDQPRKWDLPSRVYSDAEYLYPGIDINARKIVAKLDRLGYRNTGDGAAGPGDYSVTQDRLDVFLHDFSYPDEAFKGYPVRLSLENGVIKNITRLDSNEPAELSKLEPEEIASIFNEKMEDRTIVKLSDVPKPLVEAIILIEDERFFKHSGIDPWGILRAMLVNLKAMHVVQGGSTLTQQLVKNFFLYPQRSFARKLNEMLIAHRIEQTHTKAEILEAYLNEIYLGQRGSTSVSGVEEASRLYFAKGVAQLTIGECALQAGMIRSPSLYNPISHPDKARERRDFVLSRMFDKGLITKEQYAEAKAEKIVTPNVKARVATAPYFIDFVKRQLKDLYPPEVLQSEGMRIFTTVDMFMQLAAEEAVTREISQVEKDNVSVLPKDHPAGLEACLVAVQPST